MVSDSFYQRKRWLLKYSPIVTLQYEPLMSRDQLTSTTANEQPAEHNSLFRSTNAWLWVLVAVALVLDIVLTYYGLAAGLEEGNPVARTLFSMYGVLESMLLLKGIVVAVALVAYVSIPEKYQPVVPLGIALPWFVASLINASLILQL